MSLGREVKNHIFIVNLKENKVTQKRMSLETKLSKKGKQTAVLLAEVYLEYPVTDLEDVMSSTCVPEFHEAHYFP